MYIQPETIVEQYELSVSQITKGRGTYICKTDEKDMVLVPFRGSNERAEFLKSVMEYLCENGFIVEKIYRTKEGTAVAKDELEGKYILKEMFSGTECNIRNVGDIKEAVTQLALLHVALSQCPLEIPQFMKQEEETSLSVYEKHIRELIKVKNYIKNKKKKNEFERKFQEHYPGFIQMANQSVRLLAGKQTDCFALNHGDFNQHNVIKTAEGYRIIHLENLNFGISVSDLVNFLRKTMEKNSWDENLGMNMLKWYGEVSPISKEDYKLIYTLLLFPEKFWKIANHYYNSHKAWLSGRDIEKLDKVIGQEPARLSFLEKLFSFIE